MRLRPGRRRWLRNAVGSLAVLGVVAFVAIGLPMIDRTLPASRPVEPRTAVAVGAGVSLVPPPGASVDLTRTRPGDGRGTTLFTVGGLRLAVVVTPFTDGLPAAAQRLRNKITSTTGYQVTGGEREVNTDAGVAGLRGMYNSPGRLGEYAVFVAEGLVVEVTASGPEDQLRARGPELDQSLRTLAIRGRPS